MSSNVDVVNGAYESFAVGDVPAVIAALDENVVWDSPSPLPQRGSFRGPDGVGSFFQAVGSSWEGLKLDIQDMLDAGDDVIAIGRGAGTLSAGGASAGYGFAHVFTLRDGKIVRFREYADPDDALLGAA